MANVKPQQIKNKKIMTKKNNTKNEVSAGGVMGVAAGLAALAAGSYFIFGPQGKKNRKAIKGWTLKMKGEVLEKIEKLKEVTPDLYNKVIDDVSAKYAKAKDISAEELAMLVTDMKKHWKAISNDLAPKKKAAKKAVKKVVAKMTK